MMAQYAVAFDLDTKKMRSDGYSDSEITKVYQEVKEALKKCGFTCHAQGSLYHTEKDQDPITALMKLQSTLKMYAPTFCKYVRRIHVFRMEEWSDVTELITDRNSSLNLAATEPTPEEELEETEIIHLALADED